MQPTISNSKRRWVASLAAVAILAAMTAGVVLLKNNGKQASNTTPSASATTSPPATSTMAVSPESTTTNPNVTTPSTIYKNGTYTATGNYTSPGGAQAITVTVTINNDIVTDTSADPQPSDHESAQYQDIFVENFKQYVVGRNAGNVFLTRVSGSSLTSRGFNGALDQIKQQAKA
jgi:hypothetical protein